jgi:hypothetical protein
MSRRSLFIGATTLGIVSLSGGVVLGSTVITRTGRAVTQIRVLSDATTQTLGDTQWQDLPGATTSVTVPQKTSAVILARFTAATTCNGEQGKPCLARILIGGQEADPALGDRSYIDSTPNVSTPGNNADSPEAHTIERSLGPLPAGTYAVTVQYKNAVGTSTTFDGWNLTVERSKLPAA